MLNKWALIAPLAFGVGCGGNSDGLVRVAVNGKVTRGGKPVSAAILNFTPTDANAKVPNVSAMVTNGAFTLSNENGPVAGKYRVEAEITGESKVATEISSGVKGGRILGKTVAPPEVKPGEVIDKPLTAEVVVPQGVKSTELTIDLK